MRAAAPMPHPYLLDLAAGCRNLMRMDLLHRLVLTVSLALVALPAPADERIIQFLEDHYTHALLRQVGPEAEGAPAALGVADCTDRRALSRHQRNLARRLGRTFERSGVHIDLLATSAWCQAIETAWLLELRPVTVEPVLNAFAEDDTDAADAVLDLLDGMRASETALLVTHAGNIKALTGRDSRPGEVIVVQLRPGEDLRVVGAYLPE